MEKTLYLCHRDDISVIKDGPSVLVKQKLSADMRVPIREIERVVLIGNVKLEAAVITLFTSHLIPVSFIDRQGNIEAIVLKYDESEVEKMTQQRRLLEWEENFNRFKTFAEAKKITLLMTTVRKFDVGLWKRFCRQGFNFVDYHFFLQRRIRLGDNIGIVRGTATGLIHQMVLNFIRFYGFDPHFGILHRKCNFGFCKDFLFMLEGEIDRQVLQFARDKEGVKITERCDKQEVIKREYLKEIVNRFENRRPQIRSEIKLLFDDLYGLFREV